MPSADERETAMEVDDPPNPDDTAAKSNADPSAVRFNQGIPGKYMYTYLCDFLTLRYLCKL